MTAVRASVAEQHPALVAEAPADDLQAAALGWYAAHGRDLAFRRTADPWAVLVSEVMAQQTQAARAADAWTAFIDRYPTPAALAAASPAEVIRAWRGLGYNRRAIALRAAATRIVAVHDGVVPDALEALELLPGIGPYTARAVLAIAFGRRVAALDTNIRRVLDRSVGPLPAGARERQTAADGFVPAGRSAAWTHALMDIGATFCRKREPCCEACPIRASCAFVRKGATPALQPSRRAPRFEATNRWLRGRILDLLRDAPDGIWVVFEGPIGTHDLVAVDAGLESLRAEGFLERADGETSRARLV